MKRTLATLATMAAATATVVSGAVSAHATTADPPRYVRVNAAPHGAPTTFDRIVGLNLVTRTHRVIHIRVPFRDRDSLELLGRSPNGFVVVDHRATKVLEVSYNGAVRTIRRYSEEYLGLLEFGMSTNGRLIYSDLYDRGGGDNIFVFDLHGRSHGSRYFSNGGGVVAFVGRKLFVSPGEFGRLVRWTIGAGMTTLRPKGVELFDQKHGLLVRLLNIDQNVDYHSGLVTFSHPNVVRWRLCETCGYGEFLDEFAPDGRHVSGARTNNGSWVGIRRVSDGHRTSWRFSMKVGATRWESADAVLVSVTRSSDKYRALLRCHLGGGCARVTDWQPHALLGWNRDLALHHIDGG